MNRVLFAIAIAVVAVVLCVQQTRPGREFVYRTDSEGDDDAARNALRTLRHVGKQLAQSLPPYAAARAMRALRSADLVERRDGDLGVAVGKGRRIEVCVRALTEPERLHVFLHELAHTAARSVGHTDEHASLQRILVEAARHNGYVVDVPVGTRCQPPLAASQ